MVSFCQGEAGVYGEVGASGPDGIKVGRMETSGRLMTDTQLTSPYTV